MAWAREEIVSINTPTAIMGYSCHGMNDWESDEDNCHTRAVMTSKYQLLTGIARTINLFISAFFFGSAPLLPSSSCRMSLILRTWVSLHMK